MSVYEFGIARKEICDDQIGLQMAGFADQNQKSTTKVKDLYARAFVIRELADKSVPICIVIVDLWACSSLVKSKVLEKLNAQKPSGITEANLMICATHTHAGPAGTSGSKLYDSLLGKGEMNNVNVPLLVPGNKEIQLAVIDAISGAISSALGTMRQGTLRLSRRDIGKSIEELGVRQRSKKAYDANTPERRSDYLRDIDTEMMTLSFHPSGLADPVGMINWYPIHPTCLRQSNTKISGDCLGEAAKNLESPDSPLVAAFANANCGDVSPNVGVQAGDVDPAGDNARMVGIGKLLSDTADELSKSFGPVLNGPISTHFAKRNMGTISILGTGDRTWPAAIGLSFLAGSSEDSVTRISLKDMCDALKGLLDNEATPRDLFEILKNELDKVVDASVDDLCKKLKDMAEGLLAKVEEGITRSSLPGVAAALPDLMTLLTSLSFGTSSSIASDLRDGHGEKPIVLNAGDHENFVPNTLPLQVFQIGPLAILGFPGELTTMAGRLLRESMLKNFEPNGQQIDDVALSCFANDYAQYVTTRDEYRMQHYEGASTLFGPNTLAAFQQEFAALDDKEAMNLQIMTPRLGYEIVASWKVLKFDETTNNRAVCVKNGPGAFTDIVIPAYAQNARVALRHAEGAEIWGTNLQVTPRQRRKVTARTDNSALHLETLEMKIYVKNSTNFRLRMWVFYTVDGGQEKSDYADTEYFTRNKGAGIKMPWNATAVRCRVDWEEWFSWEHHLDFSAPDLRSGETLYLEVKNENGMQLCFASKTLD